MSSGEPGSGSTRVTRSNWLPWLLCTVIAYTDSTSGSRLGANSATPDTVVNATRSSAPSATVTPTSPLYSLSNRSLLVTSTGRPGYHRPSAPRPRNSASQRSTSRPHCSTPYGPLRWAQRSR